jgi:hypothetical protein
MVLVPYGDVVLVLVGYGSLMACSLPKLEMKRREKTRVTHNILPITPVFCNKGLVAAFLSQPAKTYSNPQIDTFRSF